MLERDFQRKVVRSIRERLPGCYILKNDSDYMPGIPDFLVLNDEKWAAVEVKRDGKAPYQPGQEEHLSRLGQMSASYTIHPDNAKEVLDDLQRTLDPRGATRVSDA